jgi:hypothetical protein
MLVRRVWPSRPTFENAFADFESVRREMLRLLDTVGGDTSGDVGAGVFPPMFTLSETIDQAKIDAKLTGGVLRLELPKVEKARPRQISVRTD